MVGWWWLTRPRTRGVKVLLLCDDAVLLVRQSYGHGRWTVPGGGVKRSETAAAAARRELSEEVGITVTGLRAIGAYQQRIEFKDDTVSCFVARCERGYFAIDGGEIVSAAWFPLASLPKYRRPSVDRILRMWERNAAVARATAAEISDSIAR